MAWHERDYYRSDNSGMGGLTGGLGRRMGGGIGGGLSVTMWLLIINVVIFLLNAILSAGTRTPWFLVPGAIGNFNVEQAIFGGQIWRFVTYQFLHAGLLHIFFNMLILYFFGPLMESWWGSRRFLAFYLLCGVSGAAVVGILFWVPGLLMMNQDTTLVGASGAIFGILAGCAILFPHQRVMLLFPPVPMSMRTLALILLGIAVLTLVVGAPNAGGQAAHLGGAALGALLVKRAHWLDWADGFHVPRGQGLKKKLERVQQARRQRDEKEVDRILDKVKEHGIQSLTRSEKKTLNRATEREREKRAG